METVNPNVLARLKFDDQGLIPAIVQDASSGELLTLAYMTRETLELSLKHRETYFWSRSRQKLWHKGETSGNVQKIERIEVDCDGDALLIRVHPQGPACHTGNSSCFFTELVAGGEPGSAELQHPERFSTVVERLFHVIRQRKASMPEGSYTAYLFSKGLDKILKKVGEESAETIIAAKNHSRRELILESSDLIYHLLVLLVNEGLELDEVIAELDRRAQRPTAASDAG
ncbi:MAG: bifunctional phosphoribosyl-AMP cyclohydrolase/phosphoribosyl-ATP diphosphatase HisIE [Acidobacteriota bacterium]